MKEYIKKETIINNHIVDGEFIEQDVETKKHVVVVDSAESMAYITSTLIGVLDEISGVEMKVIAYCAINSEFNTNLVNLTKPACEIMSNKISLKYQTIKNAISSLKKKNILVSLGSGTYRVNPRYSWRGTKTDRKKTMKYILEVECPNC